MIDSSAQHPSDRYPPDASGGGDGGGDGLDGGMLWHVPPGQSAGLMAAYREAVRQAAELAAGFDRAGLAGEMVAVTAGIDPAGAPMVTAVLTWAGARRLAALLAAGNPPPGLALYKGRPPWAA